MHNTNAIEKLCVCIVGYFLYGLLKFSVKQYILKFKFIHFTFVGLFLWQEHLAVLRVYS